MGTISKLLAATTIAGAAVLSSPAAAQPVQFTFTSLAGPTSDFSFIVDSSPIPNSSAINEFHLDSIDVTYGGTASTGFLAFYTTAKGGGLSDLVLFDLFGPQLFSGTTDAPVFLTGSFGLNDSAGAPAGTLTINAAGGVPEPVTWAMMLLGFGAMGLVIRRERKGEIVRPA
jgi:hypothetical protein